MKLRTRKQICGVLGCLSFGAGVAYGSEASGLPATFSFNIDRQPLDGALQQLARQSGLQVIFFSSVTDGLAAPAIEGTHTLDSAMGELLAGSGLSFRVIDDQTIEVRPPRMRAARRSSAHERASDATAAKRGKDRDPGELEEVVVVGLVEQLVATRIATPLRDIPQTMSIVSREQIRLQNDTDLAGVLDHAPGITTIRGSSIDRNFYSRGYSIDSFHVDGGAALNPSMTVSVPLRGTPDLSEFDHVEILRGADSLFGSDAAPGGTVSLVRKRPQHHFATELTATTGSWDDRRLEIDVTGPLGFDGALRGRADVVYDQDGYFFDIDAHERKKVFAVIDYDFTPQTTLTVGGSYQWDAGPVLEGGVPMYQDGRDSRLPRDTALSFDWSGYENRLAEVYLQYRQELGEDWALKVNTAGWRGQVEIASGGFRDTIRLSNNTVSGPDAWFTTQPNEYSQATADITFTGTLDWFGLQQELAFGGDFTRTLTEIRGADYWNFGPPLTGVETFDPADYPDPRLDGFESLRGGGTQSLNQFGFFTTVRLHFGDWSVIGGARLNRSQDRRAGSGWNSCRFRRSIGRPATSWILKSRPTQA